MKNFTTALIPASLLAGLLIAGGNVALAQNRLRTWQQFVDQGGGRYIQVDYTFPSQFKHGFVYFNQGANQITAFILRQGLTKYPPRQNQELDEIAPEVAERYVKSGQAIALNWNLGNSGLQYANDPAIRYPRSGTACLRNTCLTAPFLSRPEVVRILRSQRPLREVSDQ